MKPLTTVVLLIILYGTETGAQCYGNKNGKCQRIKDKKFQLQGVNISPFPVHSGQLNRLRRSQETTGSRLKYEKEEKEGPLPFEPKKNVDRSKYQPFAYALPNLRPLRPIQVDPASLSNLPSRALASPPAISPFDFIVKPLTDNLMNTSMIMMNQTLPERKKQRKGKKSHKLDSHLTAKDEADTIQSSGGFGLNLKPLKSSKTDSTGLDDNGEPPKARKPAKENGVNDDEEQEEEEDEDFEGENGEIEKISRETSSTEDEDEEDLDEETNSLEDEALDEAEKGGEEETTTGEEEVSTTIETTEGAEETEENEEVTDTTESSTVSTTSRPRTTTKRPMRDRMSFLNAVKEKKPRVLPGTKPMMSMGEEEGDEEEEEEPTEESEEEEEEEEKLPKITKPGNTQARGGIKKGRTMVSKETEGKASDEEEKEEKEEKEGEGEGGEGEVEKEEEEEEEGEEEEEETPTTKAPKKPVKPKKAEKPSKKQKAARKQNEKNKKNGSKSKQSRKGAQGPDNTDIHKPGVRALLKDAPNVKYYYPPKVNLPLPSCFYNPTGYACCNIKLNNVMEETFAQMKEKKKFNPCNINMVARILQDVTQKEFEHPFETIVSLADFAQNVHFAGDLVCKVEIDGKFMLTYATPFHADAAKNATGGIGNHPGIMNIHHMRI